MSIEAGNHRTLLTALGSLAVTAAGAALIAALPWFVGVSWSDIGSSLAAVPVLFLVGLVVLWFAGLLVHVPVLTAAMPGLTTRQALTLNLSGSAISNVFPFGGPAGMGLGFAMARSWGFGSDRFASYTVTTNLWNAAGKLLMGVGVLAFAGVIGVGLPTGLTQILISAGVFVVLFAAAVAGTFRTERATIAVGRRIDRIYRAVRRRAEPRTCVDWLLSSRSDLRLAVRTGWKQMTIGVLVYLFLQGTLMYAGLAAVGAGASVTAVAVAFAIERLISLAPITPGAAGVAELGTVAALHSFGVDPVAAAAGVLLYRILMFAVEIPVGGAIALVWLRRRPAAERAAIRAGSVHGPTGSPTDSHPLVFTDGAAA